VVDCLKSTNFKEIYDPSEENLRIKEELFYAIKQNKYVEV